MSKYKGHMKAPDLNENCLICRVGERASVSESASHRRLVVPLCSFRDAGNVTITEALRWSIMECDDPDITSEVQRLGTKLKLFISGHNSKDNLPTK